MGSRRPHLCVCGYPTHGRVPTACTTEQRRHLKVVVNREISSGGAEEARIIVDQFDPSHMVAGGTDTCIFDIVRFAQPDVDVLLVGICIDYRYRLGVWQKIEIGGKHIDYLPVARFSRDRRPGKIRLPDSLKLARGLWRYRSHIKNIPSTKRPVFQAHRIEIGAVIQFLVRPRRYVQFLHNAATGLTSKNSDSLWKYIRPMYGAVEHRVLERSDAIVVFSRTDGERLSKHYRAVAARTWYDPDVFRCIERPASLLDPELQRIQPLRVVHVGRLESQKDPVLVVQTFAAIARKLNGPARLTLIGDGSMRADVLAEAERLRVDSLLDLMGTLSRHEVAQQMQDSSMMLLLSHYEGSPRALVEACACGLVVVATESADPDRVLNGETNGIAVPSRDPEYIAESALELLKYPINRKGCAASVADRSASTSIPALLKQTQLTATSKTDAR